jgi:putative photosynthetic complex assembly protein
MMNTAAELHFPRAPLIGAALLLATTILAVALLRPSGQEASGVFSRVAPVETRLLRFEDRVDGSVAVLDAEAGDVVAVAAPGTNGFLRGMLRGLMRTRKQNDVSLLEPMLLERLDNGTLLLVDDAIHATLDLDAYGHTNADVFKTFLKSRSNQGAQQ